MLHQPANTDRIDYRSGLPVPASLSGKLYSVRDLFEPKLAADEAPVIAAQSEAKARNAAAIAASKALITANFAEFEASRAAPLLAAE